MRNSLSSFETNRFAPYEADDGRLPVGTVDYLRWLLRVVGWDGVLPICILAAPQLAASFGAGRDVTEALGITMPILACIVRLAVGGRQIAANHCGPNLRGFQYAVFFLAAIHLVCIDAVTLLLLEANNGRLWANPADLGVLIVLLSPYCLAMLFVMYPGRSAKPALGLAGTEAT